MVEAVGSNLRSASDDCWAVGQKMAFLGDPSRPGAFAMHVAVDHRLVARIPDAVLLRDAATVPLAGCTSFESLQKLGLLRLSPGEHEDGVAGAPPPRPKTLLVVGGAGGLGSWAISLARQQQQQQQSLTIVATASSDASRQWCQERLGADRVIAHEAIHSQLEKSSVDCILCLTEPTPSLWEDLSEVVRPYGTICLTVAGPSIQSLDLGFLFFKAVTITCETVFSSIRTKFEHTQPSTEMAYLLQMLASGAIQAPLSPQLATLVGADNWKQCLSFPSPTKEKGSECGGILDQLATGHTIGKLVMKIGGDEE